MTDDELRAAWQGQLNGLRRRVPVILSPDSRNAPVAAFALPWCGSGGVERATAAVAKVLRDSGMVTILLVTEEAEAPQPPWILESFDAVVAVLDANTGDILGSPPASVDAALNEWEGHALPDPTAAQHSPGLGVLGVGDLLIIEHSLPALVRAAGVRRRGTRIASHVHVLDRTYLNRPVGHPWIALAYEHAIDLFLCSAPHWSDFLIGMGVPIEKCLLVPNAPFGHESDLPEDSPRPSSQLQVLFVGREGRQKVWDTFLRIWGSLQSDPISWTVVSDAVGDQLRTGSTTWRKPLEDLGALMSTADVVVLTSDWEGVPLLVLEALRSRKQVISPSLIPLDGTKDSALHLLPVNDFDKQATALLRQLAHDRLSERDDGPVTAGLAGTWDDSCEGLRRWCETSLPTVAARAPVFEA
jgi:glycosyltransferase involved in cell wall biosynthesis